MTLAYWSVLFACFLPWFAISYAKFLAPDAKIKDFDNDCPREFLAELEGKRKRAVWAEKNLFESLPLFIAAVFIGHNIGANQLVMDTLSLCFVVLRVVYIPLYIYGISTLRTLAWAAGVGCCVAIVASSYVI